jgi:hypothetical protein
MYTTLLPAEALRKLSAMSGRVDCVSGQQHFPGH